MRLHNKRRDFTWTLIRTREVEFCIWALNFDGLRVSPWDHHPAGSGTLRALGLHQENWRTWLASVVARYRYRQARPAYSLTDPVQAREPPRQMNSVLDFWPSDTPIRGELDRWWAVYRPTNAPEPLFQGPAYSYSYRHEPPNSIGITQTGTVGLAQGAPRGKRRWHPGGPSGWALRKPLRELGSLHLVVVRYPALVAQLLPPDTVIVGSPAGDLRGRALSRLAAHAARDLMEQGRRVT